MSELDIDRSTRLLEAWDDITLGGIGLTPAEIDRRIAPDPFRHRSTATFHLPRTS
jgi:hypothetical protein